MRMAQPSNRLNLITSSVDLPLQLDKFELIGITEKPNEASPSLFKTNIFYIFHPLALKAMSQRMKI